MTIAEIRTLFGYDEWATERTLESLSSLPSSRYEEDLKSSHGGILRTLLHIYSADWIWFERWTGRSVATHITSTEVLTLDLLKSRWKEYRQQLDAYLRNLYDSDLIAPLSYSDMKGNEHSEPLYQQMMQVINHGSYHRGQIVTMLRQLGAKPLATDLIVYYSRKQE